MPVTKDVAIRTYSMSDATLKQTCDSCARSMDRDFSEFSERGITATEIADFLAIANVFNDIPTDDFYEALKMEATENKELCRANLEIACRTILVMAENKFGKKSARYKQFGEPAISRLIDDQLVRNTKTIIRAGELHLTALTSEGLTVTMLENLRQLNITFDTAIDMQIDAIKARDTATEMRIEAGNALYAKLVRFCNIGKDIWYTKNEAKHNDYIIYDHASSGTTNISSEANNTSFDNKNSSSDSNNASSNTTITPIITTTAPPPTPNP